MGLQEVKKTAAPEYRAAVAEYFVREVEMMGG
jgi:hypothetical protein